MATEEQKRACDRLRDQVREAIGGMPLKEAGLIVIEAARAMMAKQTSLTPAGSSLMRLKPDDGTLTICLGAGEPAAGMLSVAYDAVKKHMGVSGGSES